MSNALAIAGVTAVIKDLLDDGMIDHGVPAAIGQGVTVSAVAPDEIKTGPDEQPRLNIFFFQATPNASLRNAGLPAVGPNGLVTRNPPLALDLHYMITAYGATDLQAEILLGYAMLLLHETPVLTRAAIRKALDPAPTDATASILPPAYQSLRAAALADQFEQIKITSQVMNTEELSKLWTAIQSHYRPTAVYLATVVMIEPQAAATAPLPVLSRGRRDPVTQRETGPTVVQSLVPPFPILGSIALMAGRLAAQLGDTVTAVGTGLRGTSLKLVAANAARGFTLTLSPASNAGDLSANFLVPNDPVNVAAGTYAASLSLGRLSDGAILTTNSVPFAIAPQIVSVPPTAKLAADGSLTLNPTCAPEVRSNQNVSLILNDQAVIANAFSGAIANPTFVFPSLAPGTYWVRLRVDGVDSPLVVAGPPPSFAGPQIVVTT
jgi:hypothetical protein